MRISQRSFVRRDTGRIGLSSPDRFDFEASQGSLGLPRRDTHTRTSQLGQHLLDGIMLSFFDTMLVCARARVGDRPHRTADDGLIVGTCRAGSRRAPVWVGADVERWYGQGARSDIGTIFLHLSRGWRWSTAGLRSLFSSSERSDAMLE